MGRWMLAGFTRDEEALIAAMARRMAEDRFRLHGLERIEKAELPGYLGLVVPRQVAGRRQLRTVMQLAAVQPFTIAHELAHVSDIAVRHAETLEHIGMAMPVHWHLAHRMTSEYYANRIACAYVGEEAVFAAFQNDHIGLLRGVQDREWGDVLINYALILGIFHGLGRTDADPLRLLPAGCRLPASVRRGIAGFHAEAEAFFSGYAEVGPVSIPAPCGSS
ncbi:MAG: hypothetical protein HY985_06550 [Magnetospirillum sp.]|nr:hypothetical protein [Magnetospirillum sp.]